MEQNILDEVREIKKSLRLAMNGIVSTLQRRQGLDYKINFGVEIPRLKGIADAHAKNFSLIYDKDAGIRLAPFYDLVSTRAYPNLSSRFAMSIGKTWEYDSVDKDSWKRFAKSLTVRDKLVFRLMEELADSVTSKLVSVSICRNMHKKIATKSLLVRPPDMLDTKKVDSLLMR